MRYVVQYLGEGFYEYAQTFELKPEAETFAESLGKALREFYSETVTWREGDNRWIAVRQETFWPPKRQ